MSFDDVVFSRRSIRKYEDKDVSDDLILEIIKAGISAPSAHNRQPWKVKVLRNDLKNEVSAKLALKKDLSSSILNTSNIIKEASVLICVFYDGESNRDHDILSIGAFIQNMHLKVTDLGLGSLWIANTDYIKDEISGITGCDLECVSCLAVGFKAEEPVTRPRKSMEEIIL